MDDVLTIVHYKPCCEAEGFNVDNFDNGKVKVTSTENVDEVTCESCLYWMHKRRIL